jgi:hypothetical protein
MDLKDFVAATLTQIVEGVAASASAISQLGGAVSPAMSGSQQGERLGISKDGSGAPVYGVAFDVAVVASSGDSQAGGARLQVAGIGGFGGKKETSSREEITSRVKFVVPLALPLDPKSVQGAANREREAEDRFNAPMPSRRIL